VIAPSGAERAGGFFPGLRRSARRTSLANRVLEAAAQPARPSFGRKQPWRDRESGNKTKNSTDKPPTPSLSFFPCAIGPRLSESRIPGETPARTSAPASSWTRKVEGVFRRRLSYLRVALWLLTPTQPSNPGYRGPRVTRETIHETECLQQPACLRSRKNLCLAGPSRRARRPRWVSFLSNFFLLNYTSLFLTRPRGSPAAPLLGNFF